MAKEVNKPKKPKGFKAFDALARKLVQVPKAEVDASSKSVPKKEKGSRSETATGLF